MFETLFTHPAVIRKHASGPFAEIRQQHLKELAEVGSSQATLLRHAAYGLCVSVALDGWRRLRKPEPITAGELEHFATKWAQSRLGRRAKTVHVPRRTFLQFGRLLLERSGQLACPEPDLVRQRAAEFALAHDERWSSETRRSMSYHVLQFLRFVEERGVQSERASYADIDAFLQSCRARCRPTSMKIIAVALRAWFQYAPSYGWAQPGLDAGIWLPRVYSHAGLLPGPTLEQARKAIEAACGSTLVERRDHAILLLLVTYGFRATEVCNLVIDDIDWERDRLYARRAKSGRSGWVPLEESVGVAIANYLRTRPQTTRSRAVFLTVRAPFRPLSTSGLYAIVSHRLRAVADVPRGRGPHGLRHASARCLLEAGVPMKTIGDHLGHRSADSTAIYAKVDMRSLRRVTWTNVEGLI